MRNKGLLGKDSHLSREPVSLLSDRKGKSGRVVVVDNIMFIISLVGDLKHKEKSKKREISPHFLVTLFECHKNIL